MGHLKNCSVRSISLAVIAAFAFCPSLALAQGEGGTVSKEKIDGVVTAQTQSNNNQSGVQQTDRTVYDLERVGVDNSKQLSLSLQQAIVMALSKNRDIEIERASIQMSEQDLLAARGAYDPVFGVAAYFQSHTIPTSSILQGATNFNLTDKTLVYSPTFQQQLPTGGNYILNFDNNHLSTTNSFSSINPSFNSTLTFSFNQPLLRNFKLDRNRRQILIAKRRLDLSDAQFKQRAIEIISNVQRAYWDLVYTIREVQVKQEGVRWADDQLRRNRNLVAAGTLAPVEIVAAEAEVKRREEDVLTTVESVTRAENTLKGMLLAERTAPEWESVIVPTEQDEPSQSIIDLSDAVSTALANRPELEQLKVQDELTDIDVKFYRNQTKPQLDFVGLYGITGLAGARSTADNPLLAFNNILLTRVNQLSAIQGLTPLPGIPDTISPSLIGGQGQALFNLFSNDFKTYKIGISFNLTIHNRTAEGNLGRSIAQKRQISAQRQKAEETVQIDVRNAMQALKTAQKRIEAARAARIASERQLESEIRQYQAGESTNFLVLTRQNDLSDIKGREVRALTDYNKAIVDLQRAMATTLRSHNVTVNARPAN